MTSFWIYICLPFIFLVHISHALSLGTGLPTWSFRLTCIDSLLSFVIRLSSSRMNWYREALWLLPWRGYSCAPVTLHVFLLHPLAFIVLLYVAWMSSYFFFSSAESVNTLTAFWVSLHLVEHAPPLPDMTHHGEPILGTIVPACSGCWVLELERDLFRTEAETLRRSLEERDAAAAGMGAPENAARVDQTHFGSLGSSRGMMQACSPDSS